MTTSPSLQNNKCPTCGHVTTKGRSSQQNKSYWKLIIEPLAEYLALDKDKVHDLVKHKFLKEFHYQKRRDGIMEELIITKSTTSLTTKEHSEFCSQIRIWASELGCYLYDPGELSK
jgi:hypothetical protein